MLSGDINAIVDVIASITIRNLDADTKARLRVRAARHARSMEEEARILLRDGLATPVARRVSLEVAVQRRFAPFHGVELNLPAREPMRAPPAFVSGRGARRAG